MLTSYWSDCSYRNYPEEPCDCGGTGVAPKFERIYELDACRLAGTDRVDQSDRQASQMNEHRLQE